MTKEQYTPWNTAEVLDSDEAMVAYLNAALEENDPHYFVKALGNVARAKGMTAIAADSGLGRQALYRALSSEGNPRIDTLFRVLDTLDLRLAIRQ